MSFNGLEISLGFRSSSQEMSGRLGPPLISHCGGFTTDGVCFGGLSSP